MVRKLPYLKMLYIYDSRYSETVKTFFQEEVTDKWKKHGTENLSLIDGIKIILKSVKRKIT